MKILQITQARSQVSHSTAAPSHNLGTTADNVGDNVGDVAGMGSDLFGSFAEATCAALVMSSSSPEVTKLMLPAAGVSRCPSLTVRCHCICITYRFRYCQLCSPLSYLNGLSLLLLVVLQIASAGTTAFMYPLLISACGIGCCMLTTPLATHVMKIESHKNIETVLKVQLFVSAVRITLAL